MGTAGGQLTDGEARIRPMHRSTGTFSKSDRIASLGLSTGDGLPGLGGSARMASLSGISARAVYALCSSSSPVSGLIISTR